MNRIKTHELVTFIQREFPLLVNAMKQADHHYDSENLNPYHLEGDVWTHTMMVLQEAERLIQAGLFRNREDELRIASILHDLGKPMAREEVEETKRVRFIGHEGASFHLAIEVLDSIFDKFYGREHYTLLMKRNILEAISFHDVIWKGLNTDKFEKTFNKRFQFNKRLAELVLGVSLADGAGRFYSESKRQPDTDAVYENVMGLVSTLDINEPVTLTKQRKLEEKPNGVILMVGLPGSGKSTFVERYVPSNWVVISRDNLVEEYAQNHGITYDEAWKAEDFDAVVDKQIRSAISEKRSVVIDKTHMGPKSRRRSLAPFPKSYAKTAVVITENFDTIVERSIARVDKTITDRVLRDMTLRFRPPTYDDFDYIEYPGLVKGR